MPKMPDELRRRVIEIADSLGWKPRLDPDGSDPNGKLIKLTHERYASPVYVVKNGSLKSLKFVVHPDHFFSPELLGSDHGVEEAKRKGVNDHSHSGFNKDFLPCRLGDEHQEHCGMGYRVRKDAALEWLLAQLASGQRSTANPSESRETAMQPDEPSDFQLPHINTILYGPPGTGKTWTTFRMAVEICGEKEAPSSNDELRRCYLELRDTEPKRIEFVSFHQSFSYEDFVEGIRPVLTSNKTEDSDPGKTAKDSGANEELEDSNAGIRYERRCGVFREICKRARKAYEYALKRGEGKAENYVLIIDEINRANISGVMGDLITLLEKDKRQDGDHEIKVKLPYSHDDFTVPPNLYIVGTMNTADRSIALMDTALRRRFEFVEVPPAPEVLKDIQVFDINLPKLLTFMNDRIEMLLDREHRIGHAYFLGLKEVAEHEKRLAALARVFEKRIIPLLEEYFYENWDNIRLVLNDHRKLGENVEFIKRDEGEEQYQRLFGSETTSGTWGGAKRHLYSKDGLALKNPRAYTQVYDDIPKR